MEKKFILDELRRFAAANNGKVPGRQVFVKGTGIRELDWKGKYWLNWSDLVQEAGFSPNEFNQAIDSDLALLRAAELIRELGHFPQRAELQLKRSADPTFPSDRVFARKFGKKALFAKCVLDWTKENPGWDDVSKICEPISVPQKDSCESENEVETLNEGYVYLMRSGKHYKIGKTNSVDRRQYEIGIQLPEKLEPIHSIATDDPTGIERYWHQRFESKRLNGEWFKLTQKDVAIFKRRRFM